MKKFIIVLITFFLTINIAFAQNPSGQIVVDHLYSGLLENSAGENPNRRITIYLPPGYENSDKRYPVIYYLHGFTWNDSLNISWAHIDELLDKGITTGKIKPTIIVMPDHYTLFRGSWYTNSSYTGKWADFTGIDLVNYIDQKYRTIPEKESRGVAGHSMGGQGAIKMGILFPDVFSCVYALSPATLDIVKEMGIKGDAYKQITQIKTREELIEGWDNFYENAIVAMGQAYTPNPKKPPFYADLPFRYENDSLIVENEILEIWKRKSVIGMVDDHIDDLQKLKALKLDWGRNEDNPHIPVTCKILSQKLENLGINHYAEEYIGDHGNKIWTDDGRFLNDMLPFFNTYLQLEK